MPGSGPTVSGVSLIQVIAETTFASDRTGSLGSFVAVPFNEGTASFTLMRESIDPQTAVQYHHDYREEVLGKKSATLQFTMPLAPSGTAAGASTAATAPGALGTILGVVLGQSSAGTGTTASSGWTAVTGDVASGAGLSKGEAIGWIDSSGVLHARPLKNVSSNTLTLKLALPTAPSNTNVIYASYTYCPASDPDGSLQFVVRGLESQDEFVLLGGQISGLTLNLPLDGTIPTIQFSFQFANWMYGDDCAGAGSLSDITPVSYSNFNPISGFAGRFLVQTNGTTTYTGATINVSAVSFEPAHSFVPITSPSGTNTVLRHRLSRNNGPSITGSFQTYFENYTLFDARDDKLDKLIWYQIGTEAGKTICIEAATTQFTDVQRVDGNGIASVQVTWKARRDGDITSASGDLELAPWRIHFL